jgi:hypothetical protein
VPLVKESVLVLDQDMVQKYRIQQQLHGSTTTTSTSEVDENNNKGADANYALAHQIQHDSSNPPKYHEWATIYELMRQTARHGNTQCQTEILSNSTTISGDASSTSLLVMGKKSQRDVSDDEDEMDIDIEFVSANKKFTTPSYVINDDDDDESDYDNDDIEESDKTSKIQIVPLDN